MALVKQVPAESYLRTRDVPHELVAHEETATALAEARVLHLRFDEVLKAVMLRVAGEYRVAIMPASRRLALAQLAEVAGAPVRLATEEELQRDFGDFELGALPPLPGLLGIPGYVDSNVFTYCAVAFADGRRTESLIANPHRLYWGENVFVGEITRNPREEPWRFEGDALEIVDGDYMP